MTELIGYLGSALLALCAAPEAYLALTRGEVGMGWFFILTWYFGEILALVYTLIKSKEVRLIPLLFNYGLNIIFISIIIYVKSS